MKRLLLALLLGLSAQAQPNDPWAPPPAPTEFRGGADTRDPQSLGDLKWFEVFQDPQLQALIEQALQQNLDLKAALIRIQSTQAQLRLTGAAEFPSVNLTTDITGTGASLNNPAFVKGFIPRDRSVGEILLNFFSFEIDLWGRLRHQTQAAVEQLLASQEDQRTLTTILISQVASDYFNLLELDEELSIANETLETRRHSLAIVQARKDGGMATILELREAEQLVQSAEQIIPDTLRQIEQQENDIQRLLGRMPGPVERGPKLTQQAEPPAVPAGLTSDLMRRRPDIRAAAHQLLSQHEAVASAQAAYFPQITLTGLLGFQSKALTSLFTGPSRTFGFVPSIAAPLFDGGRLHANEDISLGNEQLALIHYHQPVYTAFQEVSNSLVQVSRVREVRLKQEQLVQTLEGRSEAAYLRYQGGVDTMLTALDADRDLFTARLALARTRRNELVSIVSLYKALGGGWQTK